MCQYQTSVWSDGPQGFLNSTPSPMLEIWGRGSFIYTFIEQSAVDTLFIILQFDREFLSPGRLCRQVETSQ